MKRNIKILLIIGAVVLVATPAIILGIYFGIQNRISNTEVIIDAIAVTSLTDDSLTGVVNFTIDKPSKVAAQFTILNFDISYKSQALGSGNVTTDQFSTQQAKHSTDFTLNISDTNYFTNTFVDEFIDASEVTLDLGATIQFTGGLAKLGSRTISKTVTVDGFNGLPITINSFELLEATDDKLQLEVNTSINNPTQIALTVSELEGEIDYNNTFFGNVSATNVPLTAGQNTVLAESWITGEKELISDFLSKYLGGQTVALDIDLNISISQFQASNLAIEKTLENVAIGGVTDPLVTIDVVIITLEITGPTTVNYQIDTIVSINNPVNIAINATYFDGLLVYNDTDGADFSIPLVGTWSYPAKNNITITPVTFDWTTTPLELAPSGSDQETYTHSDNDLEQGVRLYDEYYNDNSLYVSIINGEVWIEINSFNITIPIEIYNIYVPQT